MDETSFRDACWKMYQEHCTQCRHHETQRSSVAAAILVVATALIGLATFDKRLDWLDTPVASLLILLGLFGALFSAKQYERASMHTERARFYRDAVDHSLGGNALYQLKQSADKKHNYDFPRLHELRLNKFWVGLYLLISFLGLAILLGAFLLPQDAP